MCESEYPFGFGQTFQSLFGKEKPGRVRCFGRTVTPTMLKRNEEIAVIKKQHSNEMTSMVRKIVQHNVRLHLLMFLFNMTRYNYI